MKKSRAEYQRAWRLKNKERIQSQRKSYYEANKERIEAQKRAWRESNKEHISTYGKSYRQVKKHKPLVYWIESCNYIGTTENLKHRLAQHKYNNNRDISTAVILAEFENRAEALEFEKELHNAGYKGKHRFNKYE